MKHLLQMESMFTLKDKVTSAWYANSRVMSKKQLWLCSILLQACYDISGHMDFDTTLNTVARVKYWSKTLCKDIRTHTQMLCSLSAKSKWRLVLGYGFKREKPIPENQRPVLGYGSISRNQRPV